MDTNSIISLITSVGFPIVMCLILSVGFKYIFDKAILPKDEIVITMVNKLSDQTDSIVKSLDNNTMVLHQLCDKIGGLTNGKDDGK